MNEISIYEGIIIGAVGGAIAGLFIWLLDLAKEKYQEYKDTVKVEKWLFENPHPRINEQVIWRSTRSIASHNNLTEDRIRFICSYSKKIVLDTSHQNRNNEVWGIKENVRP